MTSENEWILEEADLSDWRLGQEIRQMTGKTRLSR